MTTPTPDNAGMPELLPCPFCGSKSKERSTWMCCTNPKCHLFNSACRDVDEWNTRVTPDVAGLVEALEMAAKRFRFYEQQHRNKTPPDTVKAENNAEYAEAMEQVLAAHKKRGG